MATSATIRDQIQSYKTAPTTTSKVADDLGDVESLEIALMLCTVRCDEDNSSTQSTRTISGEPNYRPLPVSAGDPSDKLSDGDAMENTDKKVKRLIRIIES